MARILIADRDEPIAALLQRAVCRSVDCQVTMAHDPAAAAAALASQTFDLVLLDIGMYSEGLETLKQIRGRNEQCQVIALTTGVIRAPLIKVLAAADAVAVITKPFDLNQLVALVIKTLKGQERADPSQPLVYREAGTEPTVE